MARRTSSAGVKESPARDLVAGQRLSQPDSSETSRWIAKQILWQRRLLELSRNAEKSLVDRASEASGAETK